MNRSRRAAQAVAFWLVASGCSGSSDKLFSETPGASAGGVSGSAGAPGVTVTGGDLGRVGGSGGAGQAGVAGAISDGAGQGSQATGEGGADDSNHVEPSAAGADSAAAQAGALAT